MNAQEFRNLYTKDKLDYEIISFEEEVGFSLIRFYPPESKHRKTKKMYVQIGLMGGNNFFYSVNMASPESTDEQTRYVTCESNDTTNFVSKPNNEEFVFCQSSKMIIHQESKKLFTLNEFIEILSKNHNRRSRKGMIKNKGARILIESLFWMINRKYNWIDFHRPKHMSINGDREMAEEVVLNLSLGTFLISRNITIILATLMSLISIYLLYPYWPYEDFSLSNPIIILLFFLSLLYCEKLSIWLNSKVDEAIENQESPNFINQLHFHQFKERFTLRIK